MSRGFVSMVIVFFAQLFVAREHRLPIHAAAVDQAFM
jgi:hypothetical protein